MQYRFLSYKLNPFFKIISIILLLLLSTKIHTDEKVVDLNDIEEITISVTPQYFSFRPSLNITNPDSNSSNSIDIKNSQNNINLYDYPIVDMLNNESVDIELINEKKNTSISLNIGNIEKFYVDLVSYKSINKKDYFSYLLTRFKNNLTNIAYINCRNCNIYGDNVYFNNALAQHTFQFHDINNEFISGPPYDFKVKADITEGFEFKVEANIEILYGKNFKKRKLIKISDLPNLGNGYFEFQIPTNDLSNSKFFKINGVYFNLTNLYSNNKPVNINYHNLEISPSFSSQVIDNTIFVTSNSKTINLKYIDPNLISRFSSYHIKDLNSPIKIISDNKQYIEKYKIYHSSLINHYRTNLLDIMYGTKIIKHTADNKRLFFSGSSKSSSFIFRKGYELSQNDNFLNILSPAVSIIKKVKINTVNNAGLSKSIVVNDYKTDSYISLNSSKYIESIELVTDDFGLSTKVFDFEFITTSLLDNKEGITLDTSNLEVIIEKVNIISTSSSRKSLYFLPNQIVTLLDKNIPFTQIKDSSLISHNFICDNESQNINLIASIYTLNSTSGVLESFFIPLGINSIIETKNIIQTLGKNDFYGMQFYAANFSKNQFYGTCSLKVNFIKETTEFIKSIKVDNTHKVVLENFKDFLPGYYLIYDAEDLFKYSVMDSIQFNHQSSMPKIQFQLVLSKFLLILLFTGLLKLTKILLNKPKKRFILNNNSFLENLNILVNNNIAVMTLILLFSLFIYMNEINSLNNFYSSYFSMTFLALYIFMFYSILINSFFIKSEIIKIILLILLIILSYNLSNDSYTYISILLFAYSFQIIKKFLIKNKPKFIKKSIDINIWSFLIIAFLSIISGLLVHFYINIKFSDYFIVYTYYSALMIFIYKFFISMK